MNPVKSSLFFVDNLFIDFYYFINSVFTLKKWLLYRLGLLGMLHSDLYKGESVADGLSFNGGSNDSNFGEASPSD